MFSHIKFFGILTLTFVLFNQPVFADSGFESTWDKERFQIRVRGITVGPDDSSTVNIGGHTDVETSPIMPEVDVTYFLNKNIALEAIAATTPHDVHYNGGTELGDVWVLPPTVTLQYHPFEGQDFDPYIGAGINYSYFYGEDEAAGFSDLEIDGGFGWALQVGTDYWIDENWGLNLDVKKIFLDIDASLNNNAITADIELDPWVVGAGISYRF